MKTTTLTLAALGLVSALALASVPGCGASPTILPTNDFNRPTDLAFMCFGAFPDSNGDLQVSGRPMRSCHPPGQASDPSLTVAFLPNSASGDLSMVDADNWKIIDIGGANPGYGRLPLGEVAEQISVSQDGCRLVSANRGACNLTMIDPSIYVQPVLQAQTKETINPPDEPVAAPEAPIDGNGMPLQVAPYEVAFLPQDTSGLNGSTLLCGDGAQTSTPWRVLVTYPSCDLVALIDLPSFRIVDSVKVGLDRDNKIVLTPQGTTPVCPISDCGPGRMDPVVMPPQTRPSGIAIVPMGDRAYVGLSSAPFVLSLPIDAAAGTIGAATGNGIKLHDGAVGSNRVRLSVDPYHYKVAGDDHYAGIFVGQNELRRFLYVIARDGTLAVIDVLLPGAEKECETNIDPLNLPDGMTAEQAGNQACLTIDPDHRRPNADGPALRFPTAPVDVMAADIPFDDDSDTRDESVGGAYAWVLTANGYTYLVNIDPVLRQFTAVVQQGDIFVANATQTEQTPFVNNVRDRNELTYSLSLDPSSGPPRLDVPPVLPLSGPYIEPLWTKGTADDATATDVAARQTSIFFRDRTAVTPQTWGVTWQGSIVGPRYAGRLLVRDNNMVLQDDGINYCYAGPGVISGDIVTINGCKEDAECGAGLACLRDKTADAAAGGLSISGLCVNKDDKDRLQKSGVCAPFTRTVRRYEVATPHGQTLELIPHLDEVIRSKLTPCVIRPAVDPENPPAELPPNDCADSADPTTATYFTCQADPFGGEEPRCLRQCKADADCRQGRICDVVYDPKDTSSFGDKKPLGKPLVAPFTEPARYCVDAPPFKGGDQVACFYQLLNYDVRVGRGFLVSGNVVGIPGSGTQLPVVGDPNAPPVCMPAPRDDVTARDYRQVSRIAIDGPAANICNPSKDNSWDSLPRPELNASPAAFPTNSDAANLLELVKSNPLPNPCLYLGGPVLSDPPAVAGQPPARHVRALFVNTEITFILADLDQAPATTLDLRFDVRGGFRPQIVVPQSTIEMSMPTRILLGPMLAEGQTDMAMGEVPYVFVVDQRRLGLGLGGGPTRGQLLRINPRGYSATLTTAGGNQPIYDDYTRSGGLFPVQ